MARKRDLGGLEQLVLLALIRLGSEAYGVPILDEIEKRADRPTSIGSIYAALNRLEGMGYAGSKLGESTPERGGRAKKYFWIKAPGKAALNASLNRLGAMGGGSMLKPVTHGAG